MRLKVLFPALLGLFICLSGCDSNNTTAQTQQAPETGYVPTSQVGPSAEVQEAKTLSETIQQQLESYNRQMAAPDFPGEKAESAKSIVDNCTKLENEASALLSTDRLAQTSGAQREDIEAYLKLARNTKQQLLSSHPELGQ